MMAAKQVAAHVEIVMKHGEELYLNQANVIINRVSLISVEDVLTSCSS